MTAIKANLKREFEKALAYFKATVWDFTKGAALHGASYHVALQAWRRLEGAQRTWVEALDGPDKAGELQEWGDLERRYRPRPLQRDESLTAETLAAIAATRLGHTEKISIPAAVEEAHRILMAARDYLEALPGPKPQDSVAESFHTYFDKITFDEILANSGQPGSLPLLPTVQAKRNEGKLTARALEQALTRFAEKRSQEDRDAVLQALKERSIPSHLLEKIRWERFCRHYKS